MQTLSDWLGLASRSKQVGLKKMLDDSGLRFWDGNTAPGRV